MIPVELSLINAISAVRLYLPEDLRPLDNRGSVLKSMQVHIAIHLLVLNGYLCARGNFTRFIFINIDEVFMLCIC